jgi:hypothetical protein
MLKGKTSDAVSPNQVNKYEQMSDYLLSC